MTIYNLHHYISKAVSIATPFAMSELFDAQI